MEGYKIFLIALAIGSIGVLIYALVQNIRGHNAVMNELNEWHKNPYYGTLEGALKVVSMCEERIEGFKNAGDYQTASAYAITKSFFSNRAIVLREDKLDGLNFEPINAN